MTATLFLITQTGWFGSVTALVLNMLLLMSFLIVIGHGVTSEFKGVFVDDRNKISLSRLQTIIWTLIVLSGFISAVLIRLQIESVENPLNISIQSEIWALLGISTTSLIGSPLIRSTKSNKTPNTAERNATFQSLGATLDANGNLVTNLDSKGQIVINKNSEDASLADLFKGEETGNATAVDIAKVQMFFFTVILVLAYFVLMIDVFGDQSKLEGEIFSFPLLDSSMLALLGISHGGYLVNKAIPHSKA